MPSIEVLISRGAGGSAGLTDRYGKADAGEGIVACCVGESGHDPDHLSFCIEQRSAGASRIDRRVELNHPCERSSGRDMEFAIEPGDDPCGERAVKAERIADDVGRIADRGSAAEHRGRDDLRQAAGGQYGDVVGGIRRLDRRRRDGPVDEGHLDRGAALDDVECRQDVARFVDHHPGAEVLATGSTVAEGLDDDDPVLHRPVHRGGNARRRLQLGERGAHLLIDDRIDVVRADRRAPGDAQVCHDEAGDHGEHNHDSECNADVPSTGRPGAAGAT